MTNAEPLSSREARINRLNHFTQKMNRHTERMKEIQAFWEMTDDQIPQFVADRVPTPDKDKPFTYEHQDKETDALLVEILEWPASARIGYIIGISRDLIISALLILFGYLVSIWFHNPVSFAWAAGFVSTYTVISLIGLAFAHRYRKINYKKNLKEVEFFIRESDAKFWNDERLKKWAVARYKLTSAESFMLINGIEGVMVEEGPMKGRFVSTSDGKEWTLRPALEETV